MWMEPIEKLLPIQTSVLQAPVCDVVDVHPAAFEHVCGTEALVAAMFKQDCVNVWVPPPQVREQVVLGLYGPNSQTTVEET